MELVHWQQDEGISTWRGLEQDLTSCLFSPHAYLNWFLLSKVGFISVSWEISDPRLKQSDIFYFLNSVIIKHLVLSAWAARQVN